MTSGFSTKDILRAVGATLGYDVYYADLNNLVNKIEKGKSSGMESSQQLIEFLKNYTKDGGYLEWKVDSSNRLESLCWASASMLEDLRRYGDVLLVDCTCGKNIHDLPLAFVVTVDGEGRSKLGFAALLATESAREFNWLFNHAISAVAEDDWANTVETIISDGDLAIASEVGTVFPTAQHLLCLWHLQKNLKINMKRQLGGLSLPPRSLFDEVLKLTSPRLNPSGLLSRLHSMNVYSSI